MSQLRFFYASSKWICREIDAKDSPLLIPFDSIIAYVWTCYVPVILLILLNSIIAYDSTYVDDSKSSFTY